MDLKLLTDRNGFTLLFLICLIYNKTVNSSDNDIKCSASKNERWNKFKKICVTCSDCPPGHFRNLTEPYTRRKGIHGDEQCLPCRQCPDGTFSENGQGECSSCRTNCTELFREYDSTCSSTQDAKCGSCLTNYEDTYGHILLPCSRKKDIRSLDPVDIDDTDKIENAPGDAGETKSQASDAEIFYGVIGGVGGVAIFVLIAPLAAVMFVRKRRGGSRDILPGPQGSYSTVSLSGDTDLDMDAAREDTVPKVHRSHVRPELRTGRQPQARSELSQPMSSLTQLDGLYFFRLSDDSVGVVSFIRTGNFCTCREENNCSCNSYIFPKLQLKKSDEYIRTTASEICHDFIPLFDKIGLKPPILYQENDSRNRDPEKITQKELVIRLLNIWIERKSTETTLQQLSMALCHAKFHKINKILFDLYRS